MKKKFTSATAAIGGATALAIAVGAMITSSAQSNEVPAPSLSSLDAAPRVAASLELTSILSSEVLAEFRPDASTARSLVVNGSRWTVVEAKDGGRCIQVETGAVTCGGPERVSAGELALTVVQAPTGKDAERAAAAARAATEASPEGVPVAPAAAARRGLVPDGVSAVRSVDGQGRTIATAEVRGNAYYLDLGLEGQAQEIRYLNTDGKVTGSSSVR